jgi:hypothetical protein
MPTDKAFIRSMPYRSAWLGTTIVSENTLFRQYRQRCPTRACFEHRRQVPRRTVASIARRTVAKLFQTREKRIIQNPRLLLQAKEPTLPTYTATRTVAKDRRQAITSKKDRRQVIANRTIKDFFKTLACYYKQEPTSPSYCNKDRRQGPLPSYYKQKGPSPSYYKPDNKRLFQNSRLLYYKQEPTWPSYCNKDRRQRTVAKLYYKQKGPSPSYSKPEKKGLFKTLACYYKQTNQPCQPILQQGPSPRTVAKLLQAKRTVAKLLQTGQ